MSSRLEMFKVCILCMIHNFKTIKINSLELLKEDQGATQFVWMNTQMNLQGKKTQTLLQKM